MAQSITSTRSATYQVVSIHRVLGSTSCHCFCAKSLPLFVRSLPNTGPRAPMKFISLPLSCENCNIPAITTLFAGVCPWCRALCVNVQLYGKMNVTFMLVFGLVSGLVEVCPASSLPSARNRLERIAHWKSPDGVMGSPLPTPKTDLEVGLSIVLHATPSLAHL